MFAFSSDLFMGLNRPLEPGADAAYLLLYVDNIVLTTSSSDLLQQIITSLHAEFSMTDLGSHNYFLGISVTRNASGMFLISKSMRDEVLDGLDALFCKPWCPVTLLTRLKTFSQMVLLYFWTLHYIVASWGFCNLTFIGQTFSYAVQQGMSLYACTPESLIILCSQEDLTVCGGTLSMVYKLYFYDVHL
ncbi:ribonuclease H-like domain-containing protein [Tanacetum coccineum]